MTKKTLDVPTPSITQLSKKWDIPVSKMLKLVKQGEKVEKEHTTDSSKASEVARDHLGEIPTYYSGLAKMEKQEKRKMSRNLKEFNLGSIAGRVINKATAKEVGAHAGISGVEKAPEVAHHSHGVSDTLKNAGKAAADSVLPDISKAKSASDVGTSIVRGGLALATKGASEVLRPTPANAGENEFERQKKMTKEETQLDEASREKISRYLSLANVKRKENKKKLDNINKHSPATYDSGEEWYKYKNVYGQRGPTYDKNERLKSGIRLAKRKLDPTSKVKIHATEETQLDENLGKAMKSYKRWNKTPWDNGDPRNVKKRLQNADPEFVKDVASQKGNLSGPAELQRRLAKRMTKEETNLVRESIQNILEGNLTEMKDNLNTSLYQIAEEHLENRKRIIASNYFAQSEEE